METERLIIDQIKETDKEDYFINISHDKKVLETFICRSALGERLLYVGLQGSWHVAISMSEDLPQQDPNSGKLKHVVNMQRNL